jgi:filamentous hemagglutinin family protein
MKALRRVTKNYLKQTIIWMQVYLLLILGPMCSSPVSANPTPGDTALPSTPTVEPPTGIPDFVYDYTDPLHPRLDIGQVANVENGTVINWENFDIGADATTQFYQINNSAWVLNRVNAPDLMATGIWGDLVANGRIIVLNPYGIVFGPDALVSANKFVASGLEMSTTDFRNYISNPALYEMKFTGHAHDGTVENNGTINAGEGIYLVGKNVINTSTGTLSCPGGAVIMAAGEEEVTIYEPGFGITVEVDISGTPDNYVVTNEGTIDADGGSIILAAGDVLSQAAITGAASFVAQADRDITINGELDVAGDIDLFADYDTDGDGDLESTAPITADDDIDISGCTIDLYDAVLAGANLTIVSDEHALHSNVTANVTASSTLDATLGNISITAGDHIDLKDTATAGGNITLIADNDSGLVGDVDAEQLNAGGTVSISASDTTIYLHDDVTAGVDILLNNNTEVDAGVTLDAGQDIILADTKTMTGLGTLTVEGDRDVILGGPVESDGTLTLKADKDTIDHEPGATVGGMMLAKSTLETTDGDIDIYGYEILLYDDVTAYQDLFLNNDTIVADNGAPGGTKLKAGNDVDSKEHLTALGNLTIEATGGEMTLHNIDMDADDKYLTLKQNNKLDLEQNIETWDNRINTHLVATSTGDSVTSEAAAKWMDITATAHENIVLSDESGNITTKQLTTTNGDIKVTAEDGKVYAQGSIDAGQDVFITATDEASDAIFLQEEYIEEDYFPISVYAERDIWLNNNTWAADGVEIVAGQDVRVGWQGEQSPWDPTPGFYAPKTLTGDGALTIEAGRHITLGGAVVASDDVAGNLILKADTGGLNGDMTAYGTITNLGGTIDIYSSDSTTYLWDDVMASGDIILHNDTEVKAANKKLESTGDDVVLAGGKTLDSDYDLTILAGDDIILGIDDTTNTEGSQTVGTPGDVSARGGDLILDAGDSVYAHGSLTSSGGSDVDIDALYLVVLYGPVTAEDNIYINVSGSGDWGELIAYDSLTANNGEIDIFTDWYITLYGPVYAYTDLTLNADTASFIDGYIYADDTLTAETGDIVGTADDLITFNNVATAGGNITLDADSGDIASMNDDLKVHGLVAGGYIDLSAGDSTIEIYKSADVLATVDVEAGGDILLNNNTWAEDGVVLDAGQDVIVGDGTADGTTLTGEGALTVRADRDITLGGAVVASDDVAGNLILKADADTVDEELDAVAGGDMTAYSTITNLGGSIDIYSSDSTTYLYDNVTALGDVILHSDTEVKTSGKTLQSTGDDVVLAGGKTLDSDYDLTILASDDIILGIADIAETESGQMNGSAGNVSADGLLYLNAGDDVYAHGTLTTTGGGDIEITSSDSTTYLLGDYINASGSVNLNNNTQSWGDIIASQDVEMLGTVELKGTGADADQEITATNGALYADDWVHKTSSGNLEMFAGYNSEMAWSLYANDYIRVEDGELYLHSNGAVYLGGDVYSKGNMRLIANENEDLVYGFLEHYGSFIQSLNGYVDIAATHYYIGLYGGTDMPAAYVSAGTDILLRDATWVAANRKLDAGQDAIVGDGTADGTTLTGDGALTVEANRDITLGGAVKASNFGTGDLVLWADKDGVGGGNMTAYSTIYNPGGSIDIYSSDGTTYLWGDWVEASDDITLHNNTELKGGDQRIEAVTGKLHALGSVHKTSAGNLDMIGGYNGPLSVWPDDFSVWTHAVTVDNGELDIRGKSYVRLDGSIYSSGNMWLAANSDEDGMSGYLNHTSGTIQSLNGDVDMSAKYNTIYLYGGSDMPATYVSAGEDILLHDDTWVNSNRKFAAGQDVIVGNGTADGTTLDSHGALTVEAGRDITLGGDVQVSADEAGDLVLWADKDDVGGGDMTAYGTIHNPGGSIDIYASDSTIYLSGDWVEASDDITLHDNTVLNSGSGDQRIEAVTGMLHAYGSVHKTTNGDLDMIGGYDSSGLEAPDYDQYSVWTRDVTVDDGELAIHGNTYVRLDGSIYSKYRMELISNYDGGGNYGGYLYHTAGTISNLYDDIDLAAKYNTIYLYGGYNPTDPYVLADNGDILLRDPTYVQHSRKLEAGDDVVLAAGKHIYGYSDLTLVAGDDILLGVSDVDHHWQNPENGYGGEVYTYYGDMVLDAEDDVYAHGNLYAGDYIPENKDISIYSSDSTTYLYGDLVRATGNVLLNNRTELWGTGYQSNQRIEATSGTMTANKDVDKVTSGNLNIHGGSGIYLRGDVTTYDGDLTFENAVTADGCGDQELNAGAPPAGYGSVLYAWSDIYKTTSGNLTLDGGYGPGYDIDLDGDVVVYYDHLILGQPWYFDDITVAPGKTLWAGDDLKVYGYLHGEGDLYLYADAYTIYLWDNVDTVGNLLLGANTEFKGWFDQYVDAGGTLTANGYLYKVNYNPCWGYSNGSLYLHADGDISLADYVQAAAFCEDCYGYGGGVSIISDNGKIYTPSASPDPEAGDYMLDVPITGRSDHYQWSCDQQGVGVVLPYEADGEGEMPGRAAIVIQSKETLNLGPDAVLTARGRYYENGLMDLLNLDYVTDLEGLEIAIGNFFDTISYEYGIYIDMEAFGDAIWAYFDSLGLTEASDIGVLKTYAAAFTDGYLWYMGLGLDDRPGVGFLAEPAVIGGAPRNPGSAFDAAIYVGSTAGNVDVSGPVSIMSGELAERVIPDGDLIGDSVALQLIENGPAYGCVPKGTMVVDAFDTVTFDGGETTGLFQDSLEAGEVGDRLEVCSRRTEWLSEAIGYYRLPYADNAATMSMLWYGDPYSYILRGAGADNPAIGPGAPAWVLEFPPEVAPIAEYVDVKASGCPALMTWLASEIGTSTEQVQVLFASARGFGYDIQPCDTCARLQGASRILADSDGTHVAALARVVNEFAAADTPPSEEQMALIAAALEIPEEGTDYAMASRWLDALTDYVVTLNRDLGLSMDDATASAGKYVAPIAAGDNLALAGYVSARLALIGG